MLTEIRGHFQSFRERLVSFLLQHVAEVVEIFILLLHKNVNQFVNLLHIATGLFGRDVSALHVSEEPFCVDVENRQKVADSYARPEVLVTLP